MDPHPFIKLIHDLLSYPEFKTALSLLRAVILGCVAVLVTISVIHTLYFLGHKTPLYRHKPPVDGWNRRFFQALVAMLSILLLIVWGIDALIGRWH